MSLIDSEDAAGRLARVIVSDIEMYNQKKLEAGANLAAELEEGYAHFRARVVPALLPLFEMVLANHVRLAGQLPGSLSGKRAPVTLTTRPPESDPTPLAPFDQETVPLPTDDEAEHTQVDAAVTLIAEMAERAEREERERDEREEREREEREREDALREREERQERERAEREERERALREREERQERERAEREERERAERERAEREERAAAAIEPAPVAPIALEPPAMLDLPPPPAAPDDPVAPPPADPEVAARRLARVIISDIEIYNPDKIANGGDLTREINEGRALFRSRVDAKLLPLFEAMLAERGLSAGPARVSVRAAPQPDPIDVPAPAPPVATRTLPPDEAPTPLMTAAPRENDAPTPALTPISPGVATAANTPTPSPTRKPRPRAVPPPLPLADRPRWAASEPGLPIDVLARLPDPAAPAAAASAADTSGVVITVAAGFDASPAPASAPAARAAPGLFDDAPAPAKAPAPLAAAASPSFMASSSPIIPAPAGSALRQPVVVPASISAARQAPSSRRWMIVAIAAVAAALAALALNLLR